MKQNREEEGFSHLLGGEPEAVVCPTTVEEVAEIVRRASEAKQVVVPWGGGTGQTYGYFPERIDILLDLRELHRVVAHEPGDLTTTVQAGVPLNHLQNTLAKHNQYLPLDPPHPNRATLGGILATDAFGASSLAHGTARDWLIGILVVDAQGRTVKGGGKVVKNVTGYDLPKLHIGALGTLGVIVEATFKVAPRPESHIGMMLDSPTPELVRRIHQETEPTMSLLRETGSGAILALIYTGFSEVVQSFREKALTIARETNSAVASLPSGMPPPFTGTPPASELVVAIAGQSASSMARHQALSEMAIWEQLDTYPGTGITEGYLKDAADPEAVWTHLGEWTRKNRCYLSARHAPPEMRSDSGKIGLWLPLPAAFPLMKRLKETLDPERILNRGRYIGGL
jgi:glycolate oxidase FAD binding subunit